MKCAKTYYLICIVALQSVFSFAQQTKDSFLRPSDTIINSRKTTLLVGATAFTSGAFFVLNKLYYKNLTRSDFQFKDDNAEWLQMDKAGLLFTAYQITNSGATALQWSGMGKKKQLVYSAAFALSFAAATEIIDGYSTNVGASWGDFAASACGTGLYVSQALLWNEQRIVPKFSFHATPYAGAQPNVLGASYVEQVFKDYNGQTYWLSANVKSFFKKSTIPAWLNVAFGYGADGIITPNEALVNTIFLPEKQRTRQFYLSFDVYLTKIPTKNRTLKTLLSIFNSIKIPAPTIEINGRGETKFRLFYF